MLRANNIVELLRDLGYDEDALMDEYIKGLLEDLGYDVEDVKR